MDSAQRAARISVAAFGRLSPGPDARALEAGLAPLDAEADTASARWIATLDSVDLDDPEATGSELQAALGAFGEASEQLRATAARLEAFSAAHAADFARADAAMAQAGSAVSAAGAALEAARTAVAALGAQAGDVTAALAAAEAAAAQLAGGAPVLGVPETVRRAQLAQQAADDARYAAATAGERTTALRRRLGSLRVRLEGVAHRDSLLEPELSRLRREHVEASWRDVEAALSAARPLLASVPERLRDAARLLDAGERARVADLVRSVVADLDRLDSTVDAVPERRRALDALAADPSGAVARASFAVRDAQRLAMSGTGPEPGWVTRLDALVARLDRLAASVAEPGRRDWWAFAQELRVVETAASDVVDDIRSARRGTARR